LNGETNHSKLSADFETRDTDEDQKIVSCNALGSQKPSIQLDLSPTPSHTTSINTSLIRDTTRKGRKKQVSAEDSQLDDSTILKDYDDIQTCESHDRQESHFSQLLKEIE